MPGPLQGAQSSASLQVDGVILSTRDKKLCTQLTPPEATADKENCCSSDACPAAEIQSMYQLPTGEQPIPILLSICKWHCCNLTDVVCRCCMQSCFGSSMQLVSMMVLARTDCGCGGEQSMLDLLHCFIDMHHAGEWWLEYLPFFSAGQIQACQSGTACPALPSGTDHEQELFRGLCRCHTSIASVQGDT